MQFRFGDESITGQVCPGRGVVHSRVDEMTREIDGLRRNPAIWVATPLVATVRNSNLAGSKYPPALRSMELRVADVPFVPASPVLLLLPLHKQQGFITGLVYEHKPKAIDMPRFGARALRLTNTCLQELSHEAVARSHY